jgi:hypothetical protein
MATLKFGKFKGQEFSSTPKWYQEWLSNQEWFRMPSEKPLHKQLNGWDGHSKKGQAFYDRIFEQEQAMENALDAHEYEPGGKYYGI